jgi:hypothetical protein
MPSLCKACIKVVCETSLGFDTVIALRIQQAQHCNKARGQSRCVVHAHPMELQHCGGSVCVCVGGVLWVQSY